MATKADVIDYLSALTPTELTALIAEARPDENKPTSGLAKGRSNYAKKAMNHNGREWR